MTKPDFWNSGLKVFERFIEDLEKILEWKISGQCGIFLGGKTLMPFFLLAMLVGWLRFGGSKSCLLVFFNVLNLVFVLVKFELFVTK